MLCTLQLSSFCSCVHSPPGVCTGSFYDVPAGLEGLWSPGGLWNGLGALLFFWRVSEWSLRLFLISQWVLQQALGLFLVSVTFPEQSLGGVPSASPCSPQNPIPGGCLGGCTISSKFSAFGGSALVAVPQPKPLLCSLQDSRFLYL